MKKYESHNYLLLSVPMVSVKSVAFVIYMYAIVVVSTMTEISASDRPEFISQQYKSY